MSNFEFQGEIDIDLLRDELLSDGSFASESFVEDEVRSQVDDIDIDDKIGEYLRYTGVNADEISDFESAVEGVVEGFLSNDNLDATLKEDLIEAQDDIKALKGRISRIEDALAEVTIALKGAFNVEAVEPPTFVPAPGFGAYLPTPDFTEGTD